MQKYSDIDNTDLRILSLLIENAALPYTEIGKRVFVSGGTVHVRMKKLEQMGIVKGSQLVIDPTKLGWDISAFLGIYLDKSSLYEQVATELEGIPEVVNIHYTTGIYSIFLKIVCRDTGHLREIRLYARGRSLERVLERLRSEVTRFESAATSALVM